MITAILLVMGLILGSFVNALVWRIHQQEKSSDSKHSLKKKSKKLEQVSIDVIDSGLSIFNGRSMCPNCKHQLAAKDLVPILSWLKLKGKCRYCRQPISRQYPAVELLTAGLFIVSYVWWPTTFNANSVVNFVVWLALLVGLAALFVYDIRWMLLPNRIIYPLIVIASFLSAVNATIFHGGWHMLGSTLLSVLIGGGLFYALFQLSGGKWIGGGDVKLGFLIGLIMAEPLKAFLVLFTASLIGTVIILPGLLTKKLKATSRVPFGPFLIIATIIIRLFGASFIAWYKRKFLIL